MLDVCSCLFYYRRCETAPPLLYLYFYTFINMDRVWLMTIFHVRYHCIYGIHSVRVASAT